MPSARDAKRALQSDQEIIKQNESTEEPQAQKITLSWDFDVFSPLQQDSMDVGSQNGDEGASGSTKSYFANSKLAWNALSTRDREMFCKNMARVALSCMAKGTFSVKREDLSKRVLADKSRLFSACLEEANRLLDCVFGFELIEAPVILSKLQGKTGPVSRYYVQNKLDPDLVGNVLLYSTLEQEWNAIKLVILSLIFVQGGFINEEDMKRYLVRFGLSSSTESLASRGPDSAFGTGDEILTKLERQGYLVKGKSQRDLNLNGNDVVIGDQILEYQWGPRAFVELDNVSMYKFISQIMGNDTDEFKSDVTRVCGAAWKASDAART